MHSSGELKRLVSIVAGVCMAAGLALGTSLPHAYGRMTLDPRDPNVVHAQWMRDKYGLSSDQVQLLLTVLATKDAEILALVKNPKTLTDDGERGVQKISRMAEDRVEAVLDSAQRAKYRKDKELEPSSARLPQDPKRK